MRLVFKEIIDLLFDTKNREVAGANVGGSMIFRAMRIFGPEAEI